MRDVSVQVKEDGVWLFFEASTGKPACLLESR